MRSSTLLRPPRRRSRWAPPAVPDSAFAVLGVREWVVPCGGATLRSLNGVAEWRPREVVEARCWHRRHASPSPVPECRCGIYAADWTEDAWRALAERYRRYAVQPGFADALVFGFTEGWGRVQLHEDGWRAQWARPAAFCLPASPDPDYALLVSALAAIHGVRLLRPTEAGEFVGHRQAQA